MTDIDAPSFAAEAWARNLAVFERCRAHPFNRELAAGTLTPARFRHYLVQDAYYLVAFGRALALLAAKAPDASLLLRFVRAADAAVAVERVMHLRFFAAHEITAEYVASEPVSPAGHHYASHILATAWAEPYEVALAALLPCYRIYAEIGREALALLTPANRFRDWVETYADDGFHAMVADMTEATNSAALATPTLRDRMHAAYATSMRLEWLFWEGAYREEVWPR